MIDIFYNEIILEALNGRINCDDYYNIIFNTIVEDVSYISNLENPNLIIPTLKISNKSLFDKLLTEYVKKALEFYTVDSFNEEIQDNDKMIIKTIMTLLWSNATFDDFNNPIEFLNKRISFFDRKIKSKIIESKILKSNILAKSVKSSIYSETPYMFTLTLTDNEEKFNLPNIYYGIENDRVFIYSIQNVKQDQSMYSKIINRLLYKVNQGIDLEEEEKYDIGNIKDVTPSFIYALNIFISILKKEGIKKIEVPSIMIERWNAKEICIDLKTKKLPDSPRKKEMIEELKLEHERIQKNMTEKLLRTFLRLKYHHSGIVITNNLEYNDSLNLELSNDDKCNNILLDEIENSETRCDNEKIFS